MRKFLSLMSLVLLATASDVAARPPQGGGAGCPADVAAALATACPCDADANAHSWKNHGKYVSCVVRFRNGLRKDGCLDDTAKRTIAKCAARSTCGKEGAVLCCVYDTSATCDDALPGDGTAAGVCSNDGTVVCDTATDCVTTTGPTLARHEERCTDKGGTVVGGGSVCSACPAPTPAP
ncbi:MAG: hypothetical protein ABI080_21840 [Candidatus Binatia bacterium]